MKEAFTNFIYQTQELALKLFIEGDYSSTNKANTYYTGTRCGTYSRTRTKL